MLLRKQCGQFADSELLVRRLLGGVQEKKVGWLIA